MGHGESQHGRSRVRGRGVLGGKAALREKAEPTGCWEAGSRRSLRKV